MMACLQLMSHAGSQVSSPFTLGKVQVGEGVAEGRNRKGRAALQPEGRRLHAIHRHNPQAQHGLVNTPIKVPGKQLKAKDVIQPLKTRQQPSMATQRPAQACRPPWDSGRDSPGHA